MVDAAGSCVKAGYGCDSHESLSPAQTLLPPMTCKYRGLVTVPLYPGEENFANKLFSALTAFWVVIRIRVPFSGGSNAGLWFFTVWSSIKCRINVFVFA